MATRRFGIFAAVVVVFGVGMYMASAAAAGAAGAEVGDPMLSRDPEMKYEVVLRDGQKVTCSRARTDNGGTLFVLTADGRRVAYSPMSWDHFETSEAR